MTIGGIGMEGVKLVAAHEFRMRLRTGRWKWLLGSWLVVVGVFTLLMDMGLHSADDRMTYYDPATGQAVGGSSAVGPALFGALMLFVLSLTLLISPALTAHSVNGDRERGTLATLQVTLLTPAEIAVGKLVAGWSVGLAALGLTLPYVGWTMAEGGVGIAEVLVTLLVVALMIGVVCAVSQALSAIFPRSVTSGLLAYLAVAALSVGTILAFFIGVSLTTEKVQHTWPTGNGESNVVTTSDDRPDRVWWLLAPNPFVLLADAAPASGPIRDPATGAVVGESTDPLRSLRNTIRTTRRGPSDVDCQVTGTGECSTAGDAPLWPWGLGFDVALGAGAVWVTIRRLRTPAVRLARGVRVA